MTRNRALILLALLPAIGAVFGTGAGPLMARAHDTVRLAERVWRQEATGTKDTSEEVEAFRTTGRPATALFADARAIERRFRVGAALLGAFLGLVIGLKCAGFAAVRCERIYTVHQPDCVACGRCFLSCPREHVRRDALGKGKP
ncbi:MAG: hypothetical protein ISS72_08415 [Candidatus Brocadiae bacterium]|nr:hypothetical protein [Candidatus Brocadiia bacterium]